jgi:hypothetical protein
VPSLSQIQIIKADKTINEAWNGEQKARYRYVIDASTFNGIKRGC